MVNEEILPTTRTISDKKELEKIFKMDNLSDHINTIIDNNIDGNNMIKNDTKEILTKDFIDSTDYTNYYVMEAIKNGFLDMEIWNKIKQFEKDNPDKIEEWKKEDRERNTFYGKSRNFLLNHYKKREYKKQQDEKENPEKQQYEKGKKEETYEDKIIKLCLKKHPKSKFVISVKDQYEKYGRISEKQMDVLKSMI